MNQQQSRARDLGIPFTGETGSFNAITDVEGVRVGFSTITETAQQVRTGVTAVLPRQDKGEPECVWAAYSALNGNGEMTGTHWINDAGYFWGPICITNTHAVGQVHHGCTQWMIEQYAEFFAREHAWALPVVAETYDGVLNNINRPSVTADHALAALQSATSGPVQEGSVGGGNGMIAYEFKGGTGTSSRVVDIAGKQYVVGALVQANHGIRPWLQIRGVPVGAELSENRLREQETGSIIVIVATDAPLSSLSLRHLARRAALGVGRGGSPGGNSSGDIFLAFSVADGQPLPQRNAPLIQRIELNPEYVDPLYLAVVDAVEESVVNALVAGVDVPTFKPAGKICTAIDCESLKELFSHQTRAKTD